MRSGVVVPENTRPMLHALLLRLILNAVRNDRSHGCGHLTMAALWPLHTFTPTLKRPEAQGNHVLTRFLTQQVADSPQCVGCYGLQHCHSWVTRAGVGQYRASQKHQEEPIRH